MTSIQIALAGMAGFIFLNVSLLLAIHYSPWTRWMSGRRHSSDVEKDTSNVEHDVDVEVESLVDKLKAYEAGLSSLTLPIFSPSESSSTGYLSAMSRQIADEFRSSKPNDDFLQFDFKEGSTEHRLTATEFQNLLSQLASDLQDDDTLSDLAPKLMSLSEELRVRSKLAMEVAGEVEEFSPRQEKLFPSTLYPKS